VIQPFDNGKFDKRFIDIFLPAIKKAGLEPYRVDRDPSVSIPINSIEKELSNSVVCLAEITTNNPNVWFELGMAIAMGKKVALVCSNEREPKFPFDIQHHSVICYETDSSSDFKKLRTRITEKLIAYARTKYNISTYSAISPINESIGLTEHEIAALTILAENLDNDDDYISIDLIKQEMQYIGYTKIATRLALSRLAKNKMINYSKLKEEGGKPFIAYHITDKGMDWLLDNQDKLLLRQDKNNS
jgi:hypothetical protein